jgi:hypothetical protein
LESTYAKAKQSKPGLPDGIFSYQNSQIGYIWDVHEMENIGIFNVHLEYCKAILYILCPVGNFMVIWYILPHFGTPIVHTKTSLATLIKALHGFTHFHAMCM